MTTSRWTRFLLAAWALPLSAGFLSVGARAAAPDLSWLAGCWEATDARGTVTQECWLEPRGGLMVGVHRDARKGSGKTFFEYLRIELKGEAATYVASPSGEGTTAFPMVEQGPQRVVFANPAHDFPGRIAYWLDEQGKLHARISADEQLPTGAPPPPPREWVWSPSTWTPSGGTDCHMHIQEEPDPIVYDATRAAAAVRAAGLSRGCLLSAGYHRAPGCEKGKPCPSQRGVTRARNDWTLAQAKQAPGMLAFCGVPVGAPWAASEVDRCLKAGGRGLKVHPKTEGVSLQNAKVTRHLKAIAKVCARRRAPLLMHFDFDKPKEVETFFRLAKQTPKTTWIAAHMLGAKVARLAEAPKNVWVEISGAPLAPAEAFGFFVPLWRAFGTDRMLLGSDWPLLHPADHVDVLRQMPLTDAERDQLVEGNAVLLFGAP